MAEPGATAAPAPVAHRHWPAPRVVLYARHAHSLKVLRAALVLSLITDRIMIIIMIMITEF